MIAVISGLVVIVLLVAGVVILGNRSMKRRESNLPPERLRAMAEGKTKRTSTRPAEDTFFESFPKGFDAFEEPERGRQRPRPSGKPGPRVAARGRRGVDEWGDTDDYDDDYWTRVRADEGGFGGSIAAKRGADRPVEPAEARSREAAPADGEGSAAAKGADKAKTAKVQADPNAATVQAPLPCRAKGLADLVETARATPSSAAAEQKTVSFGSQAQERTGERPAQRPAERPAPQRGSGTRPERPNPRGARSAGQPSAPAARTPAAQPSRTDPLSDPLQSGSGAASRPARGAGGPRPSSRPASGGRSGSRPAPGSRPAAGSRPAPRGAAGPLDTGRGASTADTGRPSGSFPARGASPLDGPLGAPPASPRTPAGPHGTPRPGAAPAPAAARGASPLDTPRSPARTRDSARGSTPARGASPLDAPPAAPHTPTRDTPRTGPLPGRGTSPLDAPGGPARTSTGAFAAGGAAPAATAASNPLTDPLAISGANTGGISTGGALPGGPHTEPPWPSPSRSTSSTASSHAPSWTGVRDVLDDPPPASSSRETWSTSGHQSPPARPSSPAAAPVSTGSVFSGPSYEVSPGYATIDDAAPAAPVPASPVPASPAPAPAPAAPFAAPTPAGSGDDVLSGGYYGGYETERGSTASTITPATPAAPTAWPEQDSGASWPSYAEMYGDTAGGTTTDRTGGGRHGSHRTPDPEYPDYYR